MTFEEILDQAVGMLQRRGRVTYRALKRQFALDDDALEDLKDALLFSHPVVDEDGRGLVWTGDTATTQEVTSSLAQPPQQPAAQKEPPPPDAERRQLTVMFCDLVGSTTLASQLDPEDYRDLLRAYQQTCAEVIHRFDGYIAQHLGDGLLVYFGYPTAHEDDAQRAVHAGLGLLYALQVLNTQLEQKHGRQLAIRVGMHTGLTVIGEVGAEGKQELLALGEAPNIAAKIQGIAAPDTVAISAATFRLVEGYFTCQDLGEQSLRGVAPPIAVYRVFQESGAQSRLDIVTTRGLTPLVGRESEITLLLERWGQVQDGQGQVILLSGEAGIGKSRLVQVLKDHVADAPHTRLECRSSPYFTNSTLYPIVDLLQRTLRFQEEDSPNERLAKLEQALGQYCLPLEETVPLFGTLLSLPIPDGRYPPLTFSPQLQRQKTLESIVAIVLEQAERQPVLLIIEDLHWLDPTTLEFIDLLIDQAPTAAICALWTCRPEFHPTWSHRSYLTEMTLNRLSRQQVEQMVERVTHGKTLPIEIVQQLVDKTDGIPLYVEEITKAVLESGILKETDGQHDLTGPLSSLAIPMTLHDSLMGRLDRLGTAKTLAQYGSVIGRQFSYDLLREVSQRDEATLQRELGRLVDAELVYPRGVIPNATYIFKHALVQDIAYESLLRSTRQHYHAQIANVLEHQFPGTTATQPELLAYHCNAGGQHEAAISYWQRAGQRALQGSAYMEAIAHLTKGLEVLQTLPETAERLRQELDLQTALGQALIATKGQAAPEVERVYARARILCTHVGDSAQLFSVVSGLGLFYLVKGELQTARARAEECLALSQRSQAPTFRFFAQSLLGATLVGLGELALARDYLEQAMALYHPQQHRSLAAQYMKDPGVVCLSYAARALWLQGSPDQAHQSNAEALMRARDSSHTFNLVSAQIYATLIYQFLYDVHATHEYAEAVVTLASEHGFTMRATQGRLMQGWARAMLGQHTEGIEQMLQALAAYRATGAELERPYFLGLLAEAYGKAGRVDTGLTRLSEALKQVSQSGEHWWEAELRRLQGALLLQGGPGHQGRSPQPTVLMAEQCLHHALDIAQNQQAKSLELRAATSLARLWQHQGKRQDAYDLLAPVYEWFTEGYDTADLQEAKALLDDLG